MRSTTRSAALLASLALCAAAASAQNIKDPKPPGGQVAPALDKIAMTEFVSDPATSPPGATQVTLRITVKNVTGGPQAVTLNGLKIRMLRTTPQPDVLELETTLNNLAAGASQTVGARVNVAPGTREYFARVDPDDTLHEPIVQRANNEKRLRFTIPQVPRDQAPAPGSQPRLETQQLDYARAKNAGAQFSNGVEGLQGVCTIGQWDSTSGDTMVSVRVPDHSPGVLFLGLCSSVNGVRATPEAFTGFHLKNGWKVKDWAIGQSHSEDNATWEWRKTPSKGTDDPSMRMHLWVNAGGFFQAWAQVKVTIEGPAGTNPYQ